MFLVYVDCVDMTVTHSEKQTPATVQHLVTLASLRPMLGRHPYWPGRNQQMHRRLTVFTLGLLVFAGCGGSDDPGNTPPPIPPPGSGFPQIALEAAFPNLSFASPVVLKQGPVDGARWFVVEQAGIIRVFNNDPNASGASIFLDITDRVNSGPNEAGLLGFAFHPGYPVTPEIYVSYTTGLTTLVSRISRFTLPPGSDIVNPASEEILLEVVQPEGNHNGGELHFGPGGFLFAGFGDGGGSGDPFENGQDTTTLLGTILRIDVDGGFPYTVPPTNPFGANPVCGSIATGVGCPEIFAWGFRNPWRFSFDRSTGELWAGDVGQASFEEVDRVVVGGNYGWNDREGAHCFDPPSGCATDSIDPVTEYGRSVGASITGGYVYRGAAIPDLAGFYVFGDFISGTLLGVTADSQPTVAPDELLDTGMNISTFAEDIDGELYVVDYGSGTIHRIVAAD